LSFAFTGCDLFPKQKTEWGDEYTMSAAYAKATELGYTGTLDEFIAAISGKDGTAGADGKSAYQIWLENGNEGTEADFLNWLKGGAHKHKYGAEMPMVPATCIGGYNVKICNECQHAEFVKIEPNDIHNFNKDGVCVYCEKYISSEGLTFALSETKDSYVLSGRLTCTDTFVRIPAEYNGKPVTSIGKEAFFHHLALINIKIPDSITSLEEGAFTGCESLTSITIPGSVTSIGKEAFYGCYSLASITIPDGVTSIGKNAFQQCCSITSITIPDSVTSIEDWVFAECSGLTSITIPDDVTSIGSCAFAWSGLTSITIPGGVTSIGEEAFNCCYKLASITFQGTKDEWKKMEKGTKWNDNTGNYTVHCSNGDLDKNENEINN